MKEEKDDKFIEISVGGLTTKLWNTTKVKFLTAINNLLDKQINSETNATVKEEAKELTSKALKFAKAKLDKASLENQKLFAEIEKTYADIEKVKAETRAIDTETELKKLQTILTFASALALSANDEDSLIFLKASGEFVNTLKGESEKKLLK